MKEGIQPELAAFLASAVKVCGADSRICAVLVGGSVAARSTDRFSDLDLIIVCRDADYAEVMAGRREFAGKLGKLLAAFTGEHVGEPPLVALDKNGAASSAIKTGSAEWPSRSAEWFEDRFWIWMHYGACKIARGELFEAVDLLSFVRGAVLGPMIARNGGRRQRGVRQVEFESPQSVEALARTIPRYDREDCWRALKAAIALYEELRRDQQPANRSEAAERAVKAYIEGLIC